MVKWNINNKKWYINKGYLFTKIKDEFEIKVENLPQHSHILVDVKCDCEDCTTPMTKPVIWANYIKYVHEDGKYYCAKCGNKLFGKERRIKTRLKNGKSFEQWCIDNNHQDIINRWDYELNKCSPQDICFSSTGFNRKGYWFKCLKCAEHKSELKNINSVTSGYLGSMDCDQCISIISVYPELIKYFVDIKYSSYSYGSNESIIMRCPNCGYEKILKICTLVQQGFGCHKCGDGIPYTEKFVFNMLEQLNINFICQLNKTTFNWCDNKQYDFYFKYNSSQCIIESHGLQHYKEWNQGRSLQEEQENDELKEQMAKENGIENYIIIDCRYSDLEFIKNNILHSKLAELFDLSNINWFKCHEYACSSLVKITCNLWNNGIKNTKVVADKLKINRVTVIKYLKQGNFLSWCNYNAKEQMRGKKYSYTKVICTTTGEIFNSIIKAKEKYKTGGISACCNPLAIDNKSAGKDPITGERLRWAYYNDEYIKLHGEINADSIITNN